MGNAFDSPRSEHAQSPTNENSVKHRLNAGLAALKQKDYSSAIAQFEPVFHSDAKASARVKARVGLVKAYEGLGEIERAIALCQPLTSASSESVREWAIRALDRLAQHTALPSSDSSPEKLEKESETPLSEPSYPSPSSDSDDKTGFIMLDQSPSVQDVSSSNPSPSVPLSEHTAQPTDSEDLESDPTGFVPLPTKSVGETPVDLTGFIPMNASPHQAEAIRSEDSTLDSSSAASDRDDPPTQPLSSADEPTEPLDSISTPGSLNWAYHRNTGIDESPMRNGANDASLHIADSTAGSSETPTIIQNESGGTLSADSPSQVSSSDVTVAQPLKPRPQPTQRMMANLEWRYAERAQRWAPMGAPQRSAFWLSQIGTAIALIGITSLVAQAAVALISWVLKPFTWFLRLPQWELWYDHPTRIVAIGLVLLLAASPWLLDALLRRFYGLKPLTSKQLADHSPEAARMLKRVCGQRRIALPTLYQLPTQAPIILSYGCLPRTARIVASQGVFQQLNEDEIAALYASEFGHIVNWDFILMSGVTLVTQIPYLLYRAGSDESDRQSNRLIRGITATVASLAYGAFWICRWAGVWLSKSRLVQSDLTASNITGNPNGVARSLLKLSVGTAAEIQRHGRTDYLLESFEMLSPVGYRSALSLGSTLPCLSARDGEQPSNSLAHSLIHLFQWDLQNPHRRWLTLNNTHLRWGDRLHRLMGYAQHWRLTPEFDMARARATTRSAVASRSIVVQGAPYFAVAFGLGISFILIIVGHVARRVGAYNLSWLWSDREFVMIGFIALALSFGIFLRINAFFPDIKPSTAQTDPSIPDFLAQPSPIPLDSQPVRLQGKLLGRKGASNWLGQDLVLDTETGLVKLHYLSQLGPIGNLILQPRPHELSGRPVIVTGWFRRGATPWIDVDMIKTQKGSPLRAGHPIWSTIIGAIAAVVGAYVIYNGGF
ncbi:MAG: M48 family metalloprotease [Elainellaceae cyanobacterium]